MNRGGGGEGEGKRGRGDSALPAGGVGGGQGALQPMEAVKASIILTLPSSAGAK